MFEFKEVKVTPSPVFSKIKADKSEAILIDALVKSKGRNGYIYEYELRNIPDDEFILKKYFLLPPWLFVVLANIICFLCLLAIFFGFGIGISSISPKMMNDYCTLSSDCSSDYNLICSNNRCSCSSLYFSSGAFCISKFKNGSICTSDAQCGYGLYCTFDSITSLNYCECSNDRFWNNSFSYCVKKYSYGQSGCLSSNECANGTNMVCSNRNCTCLYPNYWNGSYCATYLTYTNPCSISELCDKTKLLQCTVTSSLFYNCACQSYYYWSTNLGTCTPQLTFDIGCLYSTQCRSDMGLSCNFTTDTCACNSTHYWNGTICEHKVGYGSSCLPAVCDDTLGLMCTSGTCRCSNSYFFNGISCQTYLTYGLDCQNSFQCDSSLRLYCDSTNLVCKCNSLHYWNYTSCVPQMIYGYSCLANIQCRADLNLVCTSGICDCVSWMRWQPSAVKCGK